MQLKLSGVRIGDQSLGIASDLCLYTFRALFVLIRNARYAEVRRVCQAQSSRALHPKPLLKTQGREVQRPRRSKSPATSTSPRPKSPRISASTKNKEVYDG